MPPSEPAPDPTLVHAADFALVQEFLQGEAGALVALRQKCHEPLLQFLVSCRVPVAEAHDVADRIWGECALNPRRSRLQKFAGRVTVLTWLKKIALNDVIDLRRKQERLERIQDEVSHGQSANLSAPPDDSLFQLMRAALEKAIASCAPFDLMMLKFVYLKGLTQKEVGRLLGCSGPTVCRISNATMEHIAAQTALAMRLADPWLEVGWRDFLELCSAAGFSFL